MFFSLFLPLNYITLHGNGNANGRALLKEVERANTGEV